MALADSLTLMIYQSAPCILKKYFKTNKLFNHKSFDEIQLPSYIKRFDYLLSFLIVSIGHVNCNLLASYS